MDDAVIETHLENFDRRLARVEQILPTLATKEDVRSLATKEDLRSLATKEELRSLATKDDLQSFATTQQLFSMQQDLRLEMAAQSAELRREIRDEGERSRRYMDLLIEAQRGDLQLIAEHLSVLMSRLTDK